MFKQLLNSSRLLLAGCLMLVACTEKDPTPDAPDAPQGEKTTPYAVTGRVVDTQGKPMQGVKVRADNDALYGSAEVTTDANGRYTLPKLEIGGWKIYAWKEITYKDKIYHLRLGMPNASDYDAFSPGKEGAVKNFQWQLSGNIPDRPRSEKSASGYFGGSLRFTNMDSEGRSMPAGTQVTVSLTPVAGATLFDGSAPKTIQKSFTIEGGNEYNYWVKDIPQCEYRITAETNKNGVKKAIYLSTTFYSGHAPAIENFYFKPAGSSSGTYENGLRGPEDSPFYMQLP